MKQTDNTVSAFDAKTHLGQLLQEVEKGRTITITRRGKPVARLIPARDEADSLSEEGFLEEFAKIRNRVKEPVSISDLILEGRKR
jgi:prevent-host-death family protein